MNLFEVDWQIEGSSSDGYFCIYIDGGEYFFQDIKYADTSGTFKAYLNEEEHLIGFYVKNRNWKWSGNSPTLRITKIQYNEMDALTEVTWNIDDTPVELIDGALVLTPANSLEALGTIPETTSEPLPVPFSFNWEVSSEYDYDFFEIYLDDILVLRTSGLNEGVLSGFITDEEHTLKFAYVKDSSYGEYDDLARVWNVNVGGQDWLPDGGWTLGGDVEPTFQEGKIVLACGDDQSSWAERTYIPQEPPVNVRIKFFQDGIQINEVSLEALDTFFVDVVIEGFDRVSSEWKPVEPIGIAGVLEEYKEGIFEKIADSLIFEHPEGYRFLQKCNAPPGIYYLKTTATFGSITQIERLKIKAKVNI
jgi:hypothetical protein